VLKIEVLRKDHERGSFDCGQEDLNSYLRETASQHNKKNISKTFVIIDDESETREVLGFYTLLFQKVNASAFPHRDSKKYPKNSQVPVILLGRLAVTFKHQRVGLGTFLLSNALERTFDISENTGVVALFVEAKDDEAMKFYEEFEFISFPENKLHMYLPIERIREFVSISREA
jgi:GNAT superfamily N-acetyltransferase